MFVFLLEVGKVDEKDKGDTSWGDTLEEVSRMACSTSNWLSLERCIVNVPA